MRTITDYFDSEQNPIDFTDVMVDGCSYRRIQTAMRKLRGSLRELANVTRRVNTARRKLIEELDELNLATSSEIRSRNIEFPEVPFLIKRE